MTKERELLVKMVEEFAEQYVKPRANEIDETEEFPKDIRQKLGEYGLL